MVHVMVAVSVCVLCGVVCVAPAYLCVQCRWARGGEGVHLVNLSVELNQPKGGQAAEQRVRVCRLVVVVVVVVVVVAVLAQP